MSIKLLTFDLDDTLWPCMVTILQAEHEMHQWYEKHHSQISDRYTIQDLMHKRIELAKQHTHLNHDISAIRHLALSQLAQELRYNKTQEKQFVEQAFDIYYVARNKVKLYSDVIETIKKLHQRYRLVAITNGNADIFRTNTGLSDYFEFSWSAAQAGVQKPDPTIFFDVIEKTGIASEQIVHIGDDPESDILGAQNANIRSVWLNRDDKAWPESIPRAWKEIHSLYELPALLESI